MVVADGYPQPCGCGKIAEHDSFNGTNNRCSAPNENDKLRWLWPHVSGLFPSAYILSSNATSNQLYIDCLMFEAQRVATMGNSNAPPLPIYPYGQYLAESTDQLLSPTQTAAEYARAQAWGAAGTIMWGGSASARKLCNDSSSNEGSPGLAPYLHRNAKIFSTVVDKAAKCSAERCHSRGRCVDLPTTGCACFDGIGAGRNCSALP